MDKIWLVIQREYLARVKKIVLIGHFVDPTYLPGDHGCIRLDRIGRKRQSIATNH